jgi:nicotinic acid mononucleotide adenylyltransferase
MVVREASAPVYAAEAIEEGRERQLRRNLELSPEERLAEAEELMAFAKEVHPRQRRTQIIGFDSLEDFAAWKAEERARV